MAKRITKGLQQYLARENGLTILEFVVSLALISIALLSFANLLSSSLAAAVQAGRITQAAALAQEKMETLLSYSYGELAAEEAEQGEASLALENFAGLTCSHNITSEGLELDGYRIEGLRLEVGATLEGGKEFAKFVTFVCKEHR